MQSNVFPGYAILPCTVNTMYTCCMHYMLLTSITIVLHTGYIFLLMLLLCCVWVTAYINAAKGKVFTVSKCSVVQVHSLCILPGINNYLYRTVLNVDSGLDDIRC